MNKSLFAATFAASVFALSTPHSAQAQFIAPYGTGYMGANGYQYNNGTSAILSTMIQGMQNNAMMRNSLYYSMARSGRSRRSGPTPAQLQNARGRKIIKSGRATTKFKIRPMNSVALVDDWAKRNANGRAGALEEWRGQSTIWRQAMASRGAKYGDLAQAQSVAFLMCIEAYTGRQLSNAAFAKDAAATRRVYLKSAGVQGETLAQKQSDYESFLLKGSWAIYLRRQGRIEEARKTAAEFIGDSWDSDRKSVSDVQDAVATYAKYQTGPLAPATRVAAVPVTRAKPIARAVTPSAALQADAPEVSEAPDNAPQLTFAQAAKLTTFKPVAPMALPQAFYRMAPQATAEQRKTIQNVCQKLLAAVRADLSSGPKQALPVNNVALSMTYALSRLYPVATVKIGEELTSGPLTSARIKAIRTQFTLALASNADFRKMSDREKQESAEMMLVLPTMAALLYNDAREKGDTAGMKDAQELARETFGRVFGYDAEKVSFGDG